MAKKKVDSVNPENIAVWTSFHWGWGALLLGMVLLTWAVRYAMPIRDGDIWWHMLYGKYFIENHTLIADHTIFSWTPASNETIYCTWLADISFYITYKCAGLSGFFAFRYLCQFVLIATCFQYARRLKISSNPVVWPLCLVALLMTQTGTLIKPEMFTTLGMYVTVWLWWLIRAGGEKAWRYCYFIPLLMVAWVNCHGGFIFGLVFLGLACLGELINVWLVKENALTKRVRLHLMFSMLIVVGTVFLTPYGYHYPLQLVGDVIPSQDNMAYVHKIAAYTAPFSGDTPFHDFTLYADLAIVFLASLYLLNLRRGKIEWSSLLTNLAFAFLYTRFFRTTFFWAPVFLFSSLHLVSNLRGQLLSMRHSKVVRNVLVLGAIIVGSWLTSDAVWKSLYVPEPFSWFGFGISDANPVSEAKYIKKYFSDSRLGNTYDQGAYLMWEVWPDNKVFFDSRQFPYRNWSDQFFDFIYGSNVEDFTAKHQVDLWLVGHTYTSLSHQLFISGDWQLGYIGKNSAVYIKKGIQLPTGHRIVSPDIFSSKNLWQSLRIFLFACSIKDWDIAEDILAYNRNHFTSSKEKEHIEKMYSFYEGIRAFYSGQYQSAYDKMSVANPEVIKSPLLLSKCLLFIAEQYWTLLNDDAALAAVNQAASLSGNNLYIAYDLGVIGWLYRDKFNEPNVESASGSHPPWFLNLDFFIKKSSANSRNADFVDVAKAILANSYIGRPSLIKPRKF